jgi:hypothetical protein
LYSCHNNAAFYSKSFHDIYLNHGSDENGSRRSIEVKKLVVFLSFILVLTFGCSAEKQNAEESGSSKTSSGRPDTRAIDAASVVGYDGASMRRSADKALDQNDVRTAEQQKAIDQTTGK